MVNFTITSSRGYDEKEPEFIKLYNNGIKVIEIRKILSISSNAYNRLYRKCVDDGSVIPRGRGHNCSKKKKRAVKNYYKNNNSSTFRIIKNNTYYANVHNIKEAELFVELMEKYDWDKSKIEEVKEQCQIILKEN